MYNENREGFANRMLAALKWNYGGTVVRTVSQFAILVVLTRLLGPEAFGLVAVAWLVIGFGNLIADFGFGAALVQRRTISESEIRFAFTMQVLIGLCLTMIAAGSAGLIGRALDNPEVTPVVRVISLVFCLQSFGQTSTYLLRRNLNFRGLQLAQVLSYILAYVLLGIPLAYLGFGPWSLVVAQLSQSLLTVVLAYLQVRHPIKPLLAPRPAGFFDFGSKIMGVNLVNYAIREMDSVFVASFFGMTSLGLYNRAYALLNMPMNNIVSVLQGVLFSAYSRFQEDDATLKRGYLASVGVVALVILPVFASVAIVPWTVIEGLYGERWLDAVPFLAPLALAMSFQAALSPAGPIFWGKGLVGRELRIQAVVAILFVIVLLATAGGSLVMLAWGVLGVYVVRFVLITSAALLILDGTWREMLATLRGSFLVSVGTMLAVLGVDLLLGSYGVAPFIRLLGDVLTGAAAAVVVFATIPRFVLSKEILWTFDHIAHKLPWVIRWQLERARARATA